MSLARIKQNDEVIVIRGKDKGKRGRVLRVLRIKKRVVVEGVNIVTRHLKRNPQNPQAGGRQERPAPIDASNVMPWSDSDSKAVRVHTEGTGRDKRRVSSAGSALTTAGKAREKKAARKKGKE
ncbi:MAG: 50S ribosomal protein L24 [Planctomycetes bacterium]|nr:50S ribosomal protein L24 [Planctomycetota bacterium]